MANVVYRSHVRIDRIAGTHRHAWLPADTGPVDFGVHGAVAEHYGAKVDTEMATTLDYVIAATGG